jgi:hypothetical protein
MFFEVGSYLFKQLIQGFQAKLDQKHQRMVEDTVLVYFEDVFKE